MATKKKKPDNGSNVRFNSETYKLIKKFCDEKGYRIGKFCEMAAADKMQREVAKDI